MRRAPLACVALAACTGSPPAGDFVTTTHDVMSTTLQVELPVEHAALDAEVLAAFLEVEATANEWRDGSPLAAVNAAAGAAPVPVPPDLYALLEASRDIAERTDGAFDPTWAALWGLWDFRAAEPVVPDAETVAARAALVGWRDLELVPAADGSPPTARLAREGMKAGLGAIAKGWALDSAAARLREAGVEDFLLLAGGQVYAGGDHGDRPWRSGVRQPRGGPADIFATVELRDASLSTSGDYERYFERDGRRWHHILDPRSGWPSTGARSATVLSVDATTADALSTALMVMDPDAGLALVEGWPGVEALIVDADGRVRASSGMPVTLLDP